MAQMFGQVMSFDCTSQTNKQKRDEFTVTIKDGNNKLCTCMRAFLPYLEAINVPFIISACLFVALGRGSMQPVNIWHNGWR
jgi:hypothetical protein